MQLDNKTLPSMADESQFVGIFSDYVTHALASARLYPRLNKVRIIDAHGAWQNDLHRVGNNEPQLNEGLDHFKQCGHLAFWLRRMAPLVDAVDLTKNTADAAGYDISSHEQALRDLLFGYPNEYLAFDLGFQVCKFYEAHRDNPTERAKTISLSSEYYRTMCHFLKYKTVSPHAMFLIYKSLFI